MNKGNYHIRRAGNRRIRTSSPLKPSRPSMIRAKTSPAMQGPRSITGNMSIPLSFGICSCTNRCGAATARAPNHEMVYASRK